MKSPVFLFSLIVIIICHCSFIEANDAPTDIQLSNQTVPENSETGTQVAVITGTDPNGDPLSFSLQTNPYYCFEVTNTGDSWNLEVFWGQNINYESRPSIDITIRADDGNGGIYDKIFTIQVTDENDPPEEIFLNGNEVPENSPAGTPIGILTGEDQDNDPLSFSILNDPSGNFEITEDSGVWRLQVAAGASLDYETAAQHALSILTDDGNGGTYQEFFRIYVTPQQEPPTDIGLVGRVHGILMYNDVDDGDLFGSSVSSSGAYAIIGARDGGNTTDSGAAYIFKREGDTWIQKQKLLASDGKSYDRFGTSVSISGDFAIVGAPGKNYWYGRAYIFKRAGETWTEQAILSPTEGSSYQIFGGSVAISGDYAAVGTHKDEIAGVTTGSVYIFKREGETWIEKAKLLPDEGISNSWFGYSVAISNDSVVVGACCDNTLGDYSGSAYIFTRVGDTFIKQARLTASDASEEAWFGDSVSISNEHVIIGAKGERDNTGAAYVFKSVGDTWLQQAKLTAFDGSEGDIFGSSVSISGDNVVVGANRDEEYEYAVNAGSIYIFKYIDDTWKTQYKLTQASQSTNDRFGFSVFIEEDQVLIGADEDNLMARNSGTCTAFDLNSIGVRENSPTGTAFYTLTGSDPENDPLTFTLINDPSGNFDIYEFSGTWYLTVAEGAVLDYESGVTSYDITIRADDGFAGTCEKAFTIQVIDIEEPPNADAGPNQVINSVVVDFTSGSDFSDAALVTLDASASTPYPGREIASYEWIWTLDNYTYSVSSSSAAGPIHQTRLPSGTHWIKLIVTDYQGESDSDYVVITIREALPGDIDGDGRVGLSDFIIIRTHFGETL